MYPDRIEAEGEQFLERVKSGFHMLSKQDNWITISAEKTKESVSSIIEESIIEFCTNKSKANE